MKKALAFASAFFNEAHLRCGSYPPPILAVYAPKGEVVTRKQCYHNKQGFAL